MRLSETRWWWVLVSVAVYFLAASNALITEIGPSQEDTFYKQLQVDDAIIFEYQVIGGGALDIDVVVTGPNGNTIYSETKASEGDYEFNAEEEGFYRFSFSNKMSTLTTKLVSFNILEDDLISDPVKSSDIDPLQSAILELSHGLHSMLSELKYMALREHAHHTTSESTNSRVLWSSFFEWVMLCSMSLWQLYYLKGFFEVRKTV